jgi:hypothetical protein
MTLAARADVTAMMGSNTQPAQPKDEPKVMQMTVAALAEAAPALKHHLLPTLTEQKPGNSILMYYLAQQLIPDKGDAAETDKRKKQIAKYLDMPLEELPVEEVQQFLEYYYRIVLKQVEIGAMRKDADWGLALDEGLATLLPNLSDFRWIGQVLAIHARLEIARGRFDQAIDTIKTGMAMSRHVAQGAPILITALVAVSIETMMLDRVAELIAHGGPNMYWALAELPDPLIDIRPAMDWESQWLMMSMPDLKKAQAGILSQAEAAALLKSMGDIFSIINHRASNSPSGRNLLIQTALAMRFYGIGKAELVKRGRSSQEVDAMPAGQVAALYLLEDYFHWRDELFKWYNLPYWQARAGMRNSEKAFGEWTRGEGKLNPLAALLPSLSRAFLMPARLNRSRAALQTIESIRSYAARHGRAPKSLDELELPSPIDPITGRPFQYETQGKSFTLIGPAPEGEEAKECVRYEVQLTPARKMTPPATGPAGATPAALPAEGAWQGIDKFIRERTIAVVRIDLAALTSDAAWQQISTVVQESKLGEAALPELARARDKGRQIVQAGAGEAFIVIDVTDLPDVPMIVVPLGKDVDADKLAAMLPRPNDQATVHRIDGALVVASEGQVNALRGSGAATRPRLAKALAAANGPVRVALAFSDDARRALEEAVGTFPPELGNMPATMLMRGLQWACLDATVQPEVSLRAAAQSADADSAKALAVFMDLGLATIAKEMRRHKNPQEAAIYDAIAAAVRPRVRGDQLILELNRAQIVALLHQIVSPATSQPTTAPNQPD